MCHFTYGLKHDEENRIFMCMKTSNLMDNKNYRMLRFGKPKKAGIPMIFRRCLATIVS